MFAPRTRQLVRMTAQICSLGAGSAEAAGSADVCTPAAGGAGAGAGHELQCLVDFRVCALPTAVDKQDC